MSKKSPAKSIPLPEFLKGCLWSFDLQKLDKKDDFKRIVTNIMIYGDLKATRWLLDHYDRERIASVLSDPIKGEWDARSLAFWSKYLNVVPDKQKALKTFL